MAAETASLSRIKSTGCKINRPLFQQTSSSNSTVASLPPAELEDEAAAVDEDELPVAAVVALTVPGVPVWGGGEGVEASLSK